MGDNTNIFQIYFDVSLHTFITNCCFPINNIEIKYFINVDDKMKNIILIILYL